MKIAILDGPDGSVTIHRTPNGYYGDTGDFDFERKSLNALRRTLKEWGYKTLVYGSLS